MKIILTPGQYAFTPSLNEIRFQGIASTFKPENLLAVINTTTGKLVYSSAGTTQGFGGSFSTTVSPNDTLTYTSSNAGQSPTDILQCFYDDEGFEQPIGVNAADGTPILSGYDFLSGEDGLNVNLLTSSYGGQINTPMPIPNNNNALSVGFLNGGNLVSPALDPVTNELLVKTSAPSGTQTVNVGEFGGLAVNLGINTITDSIPVTLAINQPTIDTGVSSWGGTPTTLGQKVAASSVPVVIASNQSTIPVSTPGSSITVRNTNTDILGTDVTGARNAQIEVTWTVANPTGVIVSTSGGAAATASNGHTIFSSGSAGNNSSATAFTTTSVKYRPGYEMYCMFTAAWVDIGSQITAARCGLYDSTNGFAIGYEGVGFGVTKLTNGVKTFVPRASFNTDLLNGNANSKFTRNGTPEIIDLTKSNLFRIRFAWLGSANIFYEVFSPDGNWVLFHNIRQPNLEYNPSLTSPNLTMRLEVTKVTSSVTIDSSLATACWSAGTTSDLIPMTETITDTTLARLTRTVIEGKTTAGGGSYIPVKVTPSGSLTTDTTISSIPDLSVTGESRIWTVNQNMLLTSAGSPGYSSATDVTGYKSGSVQVVTGAGATGNWIFEGSNDNTNFQSIPVFNQALANPPPIVTAISAVASASIIYIFPVRFRYIRLRAGATTTTAVQCFARYSQDPFVAPVQTVVQGTAANLNCTATVSGSLTTVSTVTTVSAVTSAFLGTSETLDLNAQNIATTGSSSAVTISNTSSYSFIPTIVYTSGTGTVDVVVEESLNSGSTWTTLYAFDRISTAGTVVISSPPPIRVSGNRIRYSWTTTGTVVGTLSVTRVARGAPAGLFRRAYDRTLTPNGATPSASIYSEGCEYAEVIVSMAAGGTGPTIQTQGSEDGTNWYNIGATFVATAGATTAQNIAEGTLPKLLRASVSAAGAGSTLNYVTLKCKGV